MLLQPRDPAPSRDRRHALRAGAAAALACWLPASAQGTRSFPQAARPGRFAVRVFPEAMLDGQSVRLSAGARIYDQRNMIVMPASLSGSFDALVERDPVGDISRVWLLTPEEFQAAQVRERERARSASGR
ncbi:MAG: hypothetical protein LT103_12065 [Burkholderiaceae bacterium]|nr:hypothetical protein [Burkholderiaceae bacterium]ODS94801.1 MAG: hypothetical protein ABS56_17195 [Lautropia sp. SCN 69-89]